MKKRTRFVVLAVGAFLLCTVAQAQTIPWYSYAVKWVCGNVDPESGAVATDGRYVTSINIHNPHYLEDLPAAGTGFPLPVVFLKKIVLAQPQGEERLPHSCWFQEVLFADEALAVTCRNIRTQLALSGLPSAGLLEGFVVLLVPPGQDLFNPNPPELDVTALYTARSRAPNADPRLNGVSTWDVENVDFTVMRGSPSSLALCD